LFHYSKKNTIPCPIARDRMPTLVNELTSQQKSWLYETFGHYGEQDELGGPDLESTHYNNNNNASTGGSMRRFSTDTLFRESPTTPYQVHPPNAFPLPPPLFEHEEGIDNRNSIFRRSGANSNGRPSPTAPNERPNSTWSSPNAVDRIITTPDLGVWGDDPRLGGPGMIRPPFMRSHTTTTLLSPRPMPDRAGAMDDYHPFPYSHAALKPPRSSPTSMYQPQDRLHPRSPTGTTPIVFPHVEEKLTWQQSFENLKIYKHIYGDCNVPQKYKLNVKLGGWVVRIVHFVSIRCLIVCDNCTHLIL
jgi:Helicase associated domain